MIFHKKKKLLYPTKCKISSINTKTNSKKFKQRHPP